MPEMSYLWTTGGAGDGASLYNRTDWARIIPITAATLSEQGIARGWRASLVGSIPAANTFRIGTGGGIVDGKVYDSTTNVDHNIPSAVGGSNTRIDRIVLRASWAAQTVRQVRIPGVDAGSPTVPAMTQTSGTTYDIPLYQVRVTTGGVVTIELDERLMSNLPDGVISTSKLADGAVTGIKIAGTTIVANNIATDAITSAKIQSGAVTEIKIGPEAVTTLKLGPSAVIDTKIANLAVTTGKLANDAVDDTKAGNRVLRLDRRRGSSATDWSASGTTNYTPTMVRMQVGVAQIAFSVTVTFPVAFSFPPVVTITPFSNDGIDPGSAPTFTLASIGTGSFKVLFFNIPSEVEAFTWMATGPE